MAEGVDRKSWQCPEYPADPTALHTFLIGKVNDGDNFWEQNPGFQQLEEAIRILSGRATDELAKKQSKHGYSRLQTNRLKRNLREMVNALADVRFTPGYHSDANEWQDQSTLLNRKAASWYADRFIDRKIYQGVQWMAICPCSWLELRYRRNPGERNRCEIDVDALPAFDVTMFGMPENGNIQESYIVIVRKDVPVHLAHSMFPDNQADLFPDRETPRGWRERIKEVYNQVFNLGQEKVTAKNPTCRIYSAYILDLTLNKTGKQLLMGYEKDGQGADVETPWSYKVPSVGEMIPTGYDDKGELVYKAAAPNKCRVFPGRRLVHFTDRKVLRDGPMYDWHGMVPLVKLCADPWPFGDFSMTHDVVSIHETLTELERIAHQTARNRFWPTLLYNMKAVTDKVAKGLRSDVSGQRIGYMPESSGDPIKPLLSHDFYKIEDWFQNIIKDLREQEDYQMGVKDISAMAKMRVGAAPDSMEKLMELAGPIVKGISRNMERAMRDLAEMFKYMVFQYSTTPELIKIVGEDGVTPQNFDFKPGNLIPSHMPGENKDKPSLYSDMERSHFIADHVRFFITPNSMHEVVQTSTKLLYLQLMKTGFPISWWDIAQVMGLPNFGKKPEGTNSMLDRWMKQQRLMMEFKASLSAEAQELMGDSDGGPGSNTPGLGPNGGQKGSGGRAASSQAMPRIAQKDGGMRSTVKESR